MSLLMWNPICDSLLYYLLEKRCPALAKQFKDLFFPQHIHVTNDDLTHLVNYFSKPSKKRGLSSQVGDPEGKKIKLEETTDKHEESETPNSVARLQENETGKVTSAVLESSIDSSSDDDTPVIVTPVKKPAAPVVQLSSGSSSSSSDSDSDTEEETSSQNSSSKSHKNDQHSVNSQTPTSSSANSATNRCDFLARHTCQASTIPSTSSHDQGKALQASSEHNVLEHVGSTDPTLCSKKSSDNSKVRKSNSSHKSDSFFDRLMSGNSFPQVTKSNNVSSDSNRDKTIPSSPYSSSRNKVSKTVASPACVANNNGNKSAKSKVPSTQKSVISLACIESTPKPQPTLKSVSSRACSQSTPKSVISPACSQSTPKSVISPACSQPTPKTVISPACNQSTPKTLISPACSQSTPKTVISPACSQSTPKSVISPASSQSTPKPVVSPACSQPTSKSVISPAYSQSTPRLCRYGMDCRRRLAGDCQFTHTSVRKQSEEPRVGPGGRRICRYGGDCRRMLYCNYEHVL